MKRQGRRRLLPARAIETQPVSSGARSASSASRRNSQSSSRKRTPRWASVASPGPGGLPPPTRPAGLTVWCGARNGLPPPRPVAQAPAGAGDPRHLERLLGRQRRQDRGQPAGGQRLAGPRRPDHQQAVPAGGGDLERVAEVALAAQVGEVGGAGPRRQRQRQRLGSRRRPLPRGQRRELREAVERRDTSSPRPAPPRLRSRPARRSPRRPARAPPRRSPARPGRAHRAVQGQLADHRQPRQALPLELAGRDQQRHRDRQVQPRAGLAQAGRGEVGDDPPQRELEAAVGERRAHPLARLAHRRVGQADDGEGGQAAVHVDLDPHGPGGDAVEGECLRRGEHCGHAGGSRRAGGAQIQNPLDQLCDRRHAVGGSP